MAEIQQFISPEAQKQIDGYLKQITQIADKYKILGKASVDLQKSIKSESDAEKALVKQKQELEKLQQQKLKTDQELLKSESQLNKAIVEEQKVIQQKIKNETEVERLKQAKIRTSKADEAQLKKTKLAERSLIDEYKLEIKTEKEALEQSKRLRTMRTNLDVTSKNYEKRLTSINKLINRNTTLTKSQADADKKRTLTIGKYKEELGGLSNNLSSVGGSTGMAVSGFVNMTKASLAFIATPIGAVIGAIGLAIGALTKYFKGSEEGQNAFNKVSKITGVILGNITDIVINVGKAIFNAFSNPKQAIVDLWDLIKTNIVNRFNGLVMQFQAVGKILKGAFDLDWDAVKEGAVEFGEATIQMATGIEDAIGKTTNAISELVEETEKEIDTANKLADMEAKRDLLQRKLIVDQEKFRAKSRELRLKAEQAEGEERIRLLKEAFKIEDELASRRTEIAAINLKVKTEENKLNESTKEDLNEQAELEAELFRIQQDRLKLQRTLQTQINTEQKKQIAEEKKRNEEKANEVEKSKEEEDKIYIEEQEKLDAQVDADIERQLKLDETKTLIAEREKTQRADNFSNLAKIANQESLLNKTRAIKQALIDGRAAVQAAFSQTPGPLPVKILAATLAGGIALKNVQSIISTDATIPAFAEGTESTPHGQWLMGEDGRELKIDKKGNASLVSKPTIFNNEVGSTIFSNPDTERILRGQRHNNQTSFNDERIVKAIQDNVPMMGINKYGIITIAKKNAATTKVLNSKWRN